MNLSVLRAIVFATVSTMSLAHAATADQVRLEKVLSKEFSQAGKTETSAAHSRSLTQALSALKKLRSTPAAAPKKCQDNKLVQFGGKYAMSFDNETAQPCRIYDLSFPTVKTFFAPSNVSKVPVEEFTAKDYLNWIDGNYEAVYKRIQNLRDQSNPEAIAKNSWVGKLKFKSQKNFSYVMTQSGASQLPRSFHASDLEVGKFSFSTEQKRQLQSLFADVAVMSTNNADERSRSEQAWMEILNNPSKILSQIRFDWNEMEKVYDVFLEGEFIPLAGPIALVDYNAHYKYAVESILRNVLGSALGQLTNFIPDIIVRNLVSIAISDSFEFLNMMYAGQMSQLEDTLRAGLNGSIQIAVERAQIDYGLNILSGSQSSLFNEYILSLAQGREFDWKKLDEIGRIARYREEKTRNNIRARLNSQLVLGAGCNVERVNNYFAICSKNGQKNSVFSLMSSPQVSFWNMGAPLVHRYNMPSEVLLKRSTSWLLSAGLRIFDIPYVPNFILGHFTGALKEYSKMGMNDELYLKNYLWMQKQSQGVLSQDSEQVLKWLYIQNINPFTPKTENLENTIIQKNWNLINTPASVLQSVSVQGAF